MISAQAILPDLEDAVARRRECPRLGELDVHELRDLVYDVVRVYRDDYERPVQIYRRLVQAAVESHGEFQDAREASISIRRDFLAQLREVLTPALGGLVSPIPIETIHLPRQHDQRTYHPVLHGLQILDSSKWGPVSKTLKAWSGMSVWLVSLPPEHTQVDARYAIGEHRGEVDDDEGGRTSIALRLCTEEQLASSVRDNQFEDLLMTAHQRLVALSGRGVAEVTDDLHRATGTIEAALASMRDGQ